MQTNQKHMEVHKRTKRHIVKDFVMMSVACLFYAAGVSLFLDPNNLAPGGVTGISIILSRATDISTGTLILIINIPILLLGLWKFGFRFLFSTIYCTVFVSFLTNLLAPLGPVTTDRVLACVAGATLVSIGIGGVFRAGATTGGTDVIVKLLRLRFPHMKTGSLFMMTDLMIVTLSAFVFNDIEVALYAAGAVAIMAVVLDLVLYGKDGAKMIYIISDHAEAITQRLLIDLDLGVTYVNGRGAYSGKEKQVIMCVMRKHLSPMVEEVVKEEDPQAFMIVTSATEIYGEGSKSYFSEKL